MPSTIKIHAGDFKPGNVGSYSLGKLRLPVKGKWFAEKLPATELATIEIASEDNVKRIGGTVGWGVVGGALLGPTGMLAGLLLGGKDKEITFVAQFKDGRKMLATTDKTTFTALQAKAF